MEWWYTFIDEMTASADVSATSTTWPFKELLEAISNLPHQAEALHHPASLPQQLLALRSAETDPLPEVHCTGSIEGKCLYTWKFQVYAMFKSSVENFHSPKGACCA